MISFIRFNKHSSSVYTGQALSQVLGTQQRRQAKAPASVELSFECRKTVRGIHVKGLDLDPKYSRKKLA